MNETRLSLYEGAIDERAKRSKGREDERVFQVLGKVPVGSGGKVHGNGQGGSGCNPGRHGAEFVGGQGGVGGGLMVGNLIQFP